MCWFYLSFVDDETDTFLGAAIVQAPNHVAAVAESHMCKVNPGGQVLIIPIPVDKVPEAKWCNRLLSRADLLALWPGTKSIREIEEEQS